MILWDPYSLTYSKIPILETPTGNSSTGGIWERKRQGIRESFLQPLEKKAH